MTSRLSFSRFTYEGLGPSAARGAFLMANFDIL